MQIAHEDPQSDALESLGSPPLQPDPKDFGLTEDKIAHLPRTIFQHFFDSGERQYNRLFVFMICWVFLYAYTQNFGLCAALIFPLLGVIFLAGHIERYLRVSLNINCALYERFVQARRDYDVKLADYKLRLRMRTEDYWRGLSGVGFEVELGGLFERAGYDVEMTSSTGDGGVDLLLRKDGSLTVVQCKAQKTRVPVSVVRELSACMMDFQAQHAIIASFEGLTKPAAEYISKRPIKSLTLQDIIDMQIKYG